MTTYFACVSDSKNFQPRAIFIPMKDISKELLCKITKLTSLGNKIGEVYHYDNNMGKCIGYNIEGKFESTTPEISSIVNFFQGFIRFLEMDDFMDWDNDYWICEDDYLTSKADLSYGNNLVLEQNVVMSDTNVIKKINYPDNYQGIPINYPEILFWFVNKMDKDWKSTLENYLDQNGNKINLFDFVVIEYQQDKN
jgi:hypothetical protein